MQRQKSSSIAYSEKVALAKSYLCKMNPAYQMQICHNEKDCLMGQYPTLAEINKGYGQTMAMAWLVPQLLDLSEYCGCKEKLNQHQMHGLAYIIATDFFYLKVSELMLFFHRFKSGRYGKFYGSVDPLVITKALREFVVERSNAIDRYENEERRQKLEEEMKHAVTWQEYCKNNDMPERADDSPLKLLTLQP